MNITNQLSEIQRKTAIYNMYFNNTKKYYVAGFAENNQPIPPKPPKPEADAEVKTQKDIMDALSDPSKQELYIRLVNDITIERDPEADGNIGKAITIEPGKTVTMDLNGKTIKVDSSVDKLTTDSLFVVRRGSKLIIDDTEGNGIIETDNESVYAAIKLTDKSDTESTEKSIIEINGGTIKSMYYALVGNGSRGNTEIVINGGTLIANDIEGAAIYHPQDGIITINGGEFYGASGIYIKSGLLTVNGGSIISTRDHHDYKHLKSGFESTGDAIVVERCNYPGSQVEAVINGGTIKAVGNPVDEKETKVIASYLQPDVAIQRLTKFVKGGVYNKKVDSDLVADGYVCEFNSDIGMFQVKAS